MFMYYGYLIRQGEEDLVIAILSYAYIHTDRQTLRQTDRHTDIQTHRQYFCYLSLLFLLLFLLFMINSCLSLFFSLSLSLSISNTLFLLLILYPSSPSLPSSPWIYSLPFYLSFLSLTLSLLKIENTNRWSQHKHQGIYFFPTFVCPSCVFISSPSPFPFPFTSPSFLYIS